MAQPPLPPQPGNSTSGDWTRAEALVMNELRRNSDGLERLTEVLSDINSSLIESRTTQHHQLQSLGELKAMIQLNREHSQTQIEAIDRRVIQLKIDYTLLSERMRWAAALISAGISLVGFVINGLIQYFKH